MNVEEFERAQTYKEIILGHREDKVLASRKSFKCSEKRNIQIFKQVNQDIRVIFEKTQQQETQQELQKQIITKRKTIDPITQRKSFFDTQRKFKPQPGDQLFPTEAYLQDTEEILPNNDLIKRSKTQAKCIREKMSQYQEWWNHIINHMLPKDMESDKKQLNKLIKNNSKFFELTQTNPSEQIRQQEKLQEQAFIDQQYRKSCAEIDEKYGVHGQIPQLCELPNYRKSKFQKVLRLQLLPFIKLLKRNDELQMQKLQKKSKRNSSIKNRFADYLEKKLQNGPQPDKEEKQILEHILQNFDPQEQQIETSQKPLKRITSYSQYTPNQESSQQKYDKSDKLDKQDFFSLHRQKINHVEKLQATLEQCHKQVHLKSRGLSEHKDERLLDKVMQRVSNSKGYELNNEKKKFAQTNRNFRVQQLNHVEPLRHKIKFSTPQVTSIPDMHTPFTNRFQRIYEGCSDSAKTDFGPYYEKQVSIFDPLTLISELDLRKKNDHETLKNI